MTSATLRNYTYKDLAQMAKTRGVRGWHSMRKDQLVQALAKEGKRKSPSSRRSSAKSTRTARAKSTSNGTAADSHAKHNSTKSSRVQKQINQFQSKLQRAKNLAYHATDGHPDKPIEDRLVVMVRDPYWLHAYWELSRQTVNRVQAALGQHWHTAKPQLRLFEVANSSQGLASDTLVRSIDIHGGVNNWYVDVTEPPKSYRLEIGYLATDEQFYAVARSNIITTPAPAARDTLDENWSDVADNIDKIYAMSGGYSPEGTSQELQELLEERLRRPMGAPPVTRYGAAAPIDRRDNDFHFEADAELIVYGSTKPGAHVTLQGEPIQLRNDGTFTMRLNLPDRRQVIPVVAASADGVEQHTIVLAVERNTKRMETVIRDSTA